MTSSSSLFVNYQDKSTPVGGTSPGSSRTTVKAALQFEPPCDHRKNKPERTRSYIRAVKSAELPPCRNVVMESEDSEKIELLETNQNSQSNGETTVPYVTAGRKKIDFVLVYSKPKDGEVEDNEKVAKRKHFEEHLVRESLELEYHDGTLSGVSDYRVDLYFKTIL